MSNSGSYYEGQTIILMASFNDPDGLINPTLVSVSVRAPDGTLSTPAVTNVGTGRYEAEVTLDQAGIWRWRWEGVGDAGTAVCEDRVCADRTLVTV